MRKLLRTLIATILLFILLFISSGYFLKQECHSMWVEIPEWVQIEKKYPDWLPPYMYEIYDVVYSINPVYVPEDPNKDIWQEAEVTLEKGGDCEDWAIVIGKKLTELGYEIQPIGCLMHIWRRPILHMWIRVYIMTGCYRYDAWDVDMTVEPRIFPARLKYDITKEESKKFWNIILKGD